MKRNGKNGKHAHADAPALLEAAARSASIQLEQIEELFRALKLGRRQTSRRQVLRWFVDHATYNPDSGRAECIYHAADVARSIWVDCGHASICAAVAYWRALKIIRTERRATPGGGKLPPRAWIDWRAVVSRCGGRVCDRGAVRGGPSAAPAVAAGRPGSLPAALPPLDEDRVPGAVPPGLASAIGEYNDGGEIHNATSGGPGPSSPPLGGAAERGISAAPTSGGPGPSCAKLDGNPPNSDGGPGPSSAAKTLLHGALISTEVILAAARAVVCVSDSVSVTDPDDVDVSNSNSIRIRNVLPLRSAPWTAVRRLAAQAAAIVYDGRAPTSHEVRRTFLAAAAAALTLFQTRAPGQWLLTAARTIAARKRRPDLGRITAFLPYMAGILRAECWALGIREIEDRDRARNWFSQVMRPFELAVDLQFAAGALQAPQPPPRATAPSCLSMASLSEDERRAIVAGNEEFDASRLAELDAGAPILGAMDRYLLGKRAARLRAACSPAPQGNGDGRAEKTLESRGELEQGGAARQDEAKDEGGRMKDEGREIPQSRNPQIPALAARPP